jgi:hypothetical protein
MMGITLPEHALFAVISALLLVTLFYVVARFH